jgi:hypothetical protein
VGAAIGVADLRWRPVEDSEADIGQVRPRAEQRVRSEAVLMCMQDNVSTLPSFLNANIPDLSTERAGKSYRSSSSGCLSSSVFLECDSSDLRSLWIWV